MPQAASRRTAIVVATVVAAAFAVVLTAWAVSTLGRSTKQNADAIGYLCGYIAVSAQATQAILADPPAGTTAQTTAARERLLRFDEGFLKTAC